MDIPSPDFEVFDEDFVEVVKRDRELMPTLTDRILDAKRRSYIGYIENAFTSPDAYASTSVPSLTRLAQEWAECEWTEYLR